MENNRLITFQCGECNYQFLATGDVYAFTCDQYIINQFRGNARDGSLNNIYLRIYEEDGIHAYPLLGCKSNSFIRKTSYGLQHTGKIKGISYTVTFVPNDGVWFWNVSVQGNGESVDFVYGQDLGVSSCGSIFSNELYVSQYLGHSIFNTKSGYVVCSRQNMPVLDSNPYVQQGVIGNQAVHYSTDATQFFGLSSKDTEIPEALHCNLEDVNKQYEAAYTALQTPLMKLDGSMKSFAFYGLFVANHHDAIHGVEYQEIIHDAYEKCLSLSSSAETFTDVPAVSAKGIYGMPYSSPAFDTCEIEALFPSRKLEETEEGKIHSFFTPSHAHVVTKAKEVKTIRPHGTIVITPPNTKEVDSNLISSTHYMAGIFNSHVVIGNTDIHKLVSTPRTITNFLKNGGQRLYVSWDGIYHLLTLPGLYEMGMNYSRWFYKINDDILVVTSYSVLGHPDLVLEVRSTKNRNYDYVITTQLSYGPNEGIADLTMEHVGNTLVFPMDTQQYPGLHYEMLFEDDSFRVSDDRIFFEDNKPFDTTFVTVAMPQKAAFKMITRGYLAEGTDNRPETYLFEDEKQKVSQYYEQFMCNFNISCTSENEHTQILNETARWYCHNALIHFAMPHGLEQPGGAAWGTRDVCQGPIELFLATQHSDLVRSILLNIFSHQNLKTGEWAQWFMFDRYEANAGECHGDIIFWPLKSVADYLQATNDFSILEEKIPYADTPDKKATLLAHIDLAVSTVQTTRLVGSTGLITYAGGDWDDTLQPAEESSKQYLVSAWTEALAYQTFTSLAEELVNVAPSEADTLFKLAGSFKHAFDSILIKDGVIAGFLDVRDGYQYLVHPLDQKTGIHYRLLPLSRSIIADLASPAQAHQNEEIIEEHLTFPDGVRLMDYPAQYSGGNSVYFKRAEQAANVGREISLQYTHAHIRYIEAMAKLGKSDKAWNSLFVINPILIQKSVPNAVRRQSNMYFSSSDGDFNDRYDYDANFSKLKDGTICVKGGWRLYSSGPGIYMKQVISNILGIRCVADGIIFDPVLPKQLNGLNFKFSCFGKETDFTYHFTDTNEIRVSDKHHDLSCKKVPSQYRDGGVFIKCEDLEKSGNSLDIYMPLV